MTTDWDTLLTTPRTFTVEDQSGQPREIAVTPRVRDRDRNGERRITVTVLPLLADKVAEIRDPGHRAHAVSMLTPTKVVLCQQPDPAYDSGAMRHVAAHRRAGRVRTSYSGEGVVPVAEVLDLGEALWDHFFRPSNEKGRA